MKKSNFIALFDHLPDDANIYYPYTSNADDYDADLYDGFVVTELFPCNRNTKVMGDPVYSILKANVSGYVSASEKEELEREKAFRESFPNKLNWHLAPNYTRAYTVRYETGLFNCPFTISHYKDDWKILYIPDETTGSSHTPFTTWDNFFTLVKPIVLKSLHTYCMGSLHRSFQLDNQ